MIINCQYDHNSAPTAQRICKMGYKWSKNGCGRPDVQVVCWWMWQLQTYLTWRIQAGDEGKDNIKLQHTLELILQVSGNLLQWSNTSFSNNNPLFGVFMMLADCCLSCQSKISLWISTGLRWSDHRKAIGCDSLRFYQTIQWPHLSY